MKLSVTQEGLAKALNTVSRMVSSRSSLPVLGNILIGTQSNRLKLSATNLEVGINYWLGAKIEEEGAITVPARLFQEFITGLVSGNISLSTNDQTLLVKAPHVESSINGISAEEFPLIPQIKNDPALELPAEQLHDALVQVVVAASTDEARPILTGVYIYNDGAKLVLVSTDSYRLAEKKITLKKKPTNDFKIIVPAKTIQELIRLLSDNENNLVVYVNDNQIMFEIDGIELTSRLIDGQFPDYRQIIPKNSETTVTADTEEVARVTKLASLFARENAGSVRLDIKAEGRLDVVANPSQVGENTSSADCEVEGENSEISLNARYLSDALSVLKSPKMAMSLSGKLSPCVIQPTGANSDYLHIIMPLRT
ncbi:MAG TPA: DNA polymerase III subunit beta [Candidatus Saccharimonadales bacterium]|nr:DNA polymerase III subunit beta [Candidatus Saccharimonadales bacterium]